MGLLESAVMSVCMGASGASGQACDKAVEAGTKQSGYEQMVDRYENHQVKLLEGKAIDWFGRDAVTTVGGTVWLTKTIIDKKASIGLPTLGVCDKLVAQVNTTEALLVFKWIF